MKIEERIARRQQTEYAPRLVLDYAALNPIVHTGEPVGRGSLIERLLDSLDSVFSGRAPDDLYVWGPKGSGKSAIIRALFEQLDRLLGRIDGQIYTTTRAQAAPGVEFVYIDGRTAKTSFALLHAVLNGLVSEDVPKQGIGADALVGRLRKQITPTNHHVVVAIDHLNEPETLSIAEVYDEFEPFRSSLACLFVGRTEPTETVVSELDRINTLEVERYRRHALVEVLTSRIADGMLRSVITHEQLRELAGWADGDAHDALAALFTTALSAETHQHDTISSDDLAAGMAAVPADSVSLGRVLSLPESRQQVLYQLIELPDHDRNSVQAAADAIYRAEIDLSRATVERVLYELAEAGIIRRVKTDRSDTLGRPPSRLELRFPTQVFKELSAGG